jgi:hypothetical protein
MIRTEDELRDAICRRRDAMGVSNEWLDEFTGLPNGYIGKLLCNPPIRALSARALLWIAGAMGFAVAFVDDPQPFERIAGQVVLKSRPSNYDSPKTAPIVQVIRRSFLRKIGRKGALQRKANFDAATRKRRKISAQNRRNALKRWRKPTIEEIV